MSRQRVLVYGAGGHGKVVIDILERDDRYEITGIIDDDPGLKGTDFCSYEILGGQGDLLHLRLDSQLILAIGDNHVRRRLAAALESLGFQFARALHPSSTLARDVTLGQGAVVAAHGVVNSATTIGEHVIINTGATVDHDCTIGNFSHISPGAHLGGNIELGQLVHVGLGASIVNNVTIGIGSIIGAGAAVVEDIPPNVVAAGVPARIIRTIEL